MKNTSPVTNSRTLPPVITDATRPSSLPCDMVPKCCWAVPRQVSRVSILPSKESTGWCDLPNVMPAFRCPRSRWSLPRTSFRPNSSRRSAIRCNKVSRPFFSRTAEAIRRRLNACNAAGHPTALVVTSRSPITSALVPSNAITAAIACPGHRFVRNAKAVNSRPRAMAPSALRKACNVFSPLLVLSAWTLIRQAPARVTSASSRTSNRRNATCSSAHKWSPKAWISVQYRQ